jgi:Kdo2-lipid IVA lauroyltransferase/acyltransferase
VPFFDVPAATVTSLSRFARLGDAQVFMLTTRLTPQGYDVHVSAAWTGFPTAHAQADAQRMNAAIEAMVRQAPQDYLWTHRRFKTTPPGAADRYKKRPLTP